MRLFDKNSTLAVVLGVLLLAGAALPAIGAPIRFVRAIDGSVQAPEGRALAIVDGRVAYVVADRARQDGGVFLWDGEARPVATIRQIVPGGGGSFQEFGPIAFDGTRIAFIARDSSGITGLYLWNGGSIIRTVVDTTMTAPDGAPIMDLSRVSMSPGLVVFQAEIPSLESPGETDSAVYFEHHGSIRPVLLPGDILEGDRVRSAGIASGGLDGDLLGLQVRFSSTRAL